MHFQQIQAESDTIRKNLSPLHERGSSESQGPSTLIPLMLLYLRMVVSQPYWVQVHKTSQSHHLIPQEGLLGRDGRCVGKKLTELVLMEQRILHPLHCLPRAQPPSSKGWEMLVQGDVNLGPQAYVGMCKEEKAALGLW